MPGPGRCPRDRGKASYRDDFFANMVEPNDLGRLSFVEMTADGITDFSVKFRDRVRFSENGNVERPCDEPALRRVVYHKNQLAHGHFSKAKGQTLCGYGIPDSTQCPVREVSLTREVSDARTSLADFFSILLEWAAMSWIDGILSLTEDQWIYIGFMGSALAWVVVLTVWYMRTRTKTK